MRALSLNAIQVQSSRPQGQLSLAFWGPFNHPPPRPTTPTLPPPQDLVWVLLGVGSGSRLTVADMYQQCSYGKTMIDRSQSTVVDWVTIGCSGYGWVGKRPGCGRAVQPDATWQYAAVGWWLRDWQAGLCAPLEHRQAALGQRCPPQVTKRLPCAPENPLQTLRGVEHYWLL